MMKACESDEVATQVFIDIYNELTEGGERQKENFKQEINNKKYMKCLSKIAGNGMGKGRFAQKISSRVCEAHIPVYVRNAIDYIYKKVDV